MYVIEGLFQQYGAWTVIGSVLVVLMFVYGFMVKHNGPPSGGTGGNSGSNNTGGGEGGGV